MERNKPAIVSIWYFTSDFYDYSKWTSTNKDTVLLSGSGFIFAPEGLVATNFHVVAGYDSLFVKTSTGKFYNTILLFIEEKNDIAILKIIDDKEIEFPSVKLGNSDDLKTGNNVYAIGSPLGFEYTLSQGIVAAIRENEKVSFNDPDTWTTTENTFDKVIQITAAISPGNSGGALINSKGEVVGITTYSYGFYGNLNFAIAINTLKRIISQIDFKKLEDIEDEESLKRKIDNIYTTNLKVARSYKSKLFYSWYSSKNLDSLMHTDTLIIQKDSLNRIHLKKTEQFFTICIDLKPDVFTPYKELFELYLYTENYHKAEILYKRIKNQFQTADSLINSLSYTFADAYISNKEYEKAIALYERLLSFDTSNYGIYYNIALALEKWGKQDRAISEYKKLIRRDSSYYEAYIRLGVIYYSKRKYPEAKYYLQHVRDKDDYYATDVDLLYCLGMIAVQEDKKTEALLYLIELKYKYLYEKSDIEKRKELEKAILSMD
ncbi:MAG: trypsin-like peptidase domain-containing protein [Ignavibacteria bacterium]